MSWLFNLAYVAAFLLASPWIAFRAFRTNRYREGIAQKLLGTLPVPTSYSDFETESNQRTIWLHGVSVGEIQLLQPLLQQLRIQDPKARFVISTTTQTGMELAKKIFADEWLVYYPLDFTWAVKNALSRVQPSLIILGELELWPNFISLAHRRNIPIVVVNARLSERSFRGYRMFGWFTRHMFRKLSLVAAQNASYVERFQICGVPRERIALTGSIKFDNVNFDRQCDQVTHLRSLVGVDENDIVWLAGSTQSPEELHAAQAFKQVLDRFSKLRLIIVPRHPERFDAVYRELKSLGLSVLRRSSLVEDSVAGNWQVLLVDTVGELRWWWGLAELALVGGSFGSRGGQNMLEPAAYGANVAFGPNTSNFRDISQLLLECDAAMRLNDVNEILSWLETQLNNLQEGRDRGLRAQTLIRSHQGALQRTCQAIRDL